MHVSTGHPWIPCNICTELVHVPIKSRSPRLLNVVIMIANRYHGTSHLPCNDPECLAFVWATAAEDHVLPPCGNRRIYRLALYDRAGQHEPHDSRACAPKLTHHGAPHAGGNCLALCKRRRESIHPVIEQWRPWLAAYLGSWSKACLPSVDPAGSLAPFGGDVCP